MININLLGVCETRWINNGDFLSDNQKIVYASGKRNEREVGFILDKDKMKCVLGASSSWEQYFW